MSQAVEEAVSRGLDAILERIKQNPSSTLVSRYLSLVAELGDEVEKAQRALAVARIIQAARPAEALNIAHMVYATGHEVVAALDVMIASLDARGRYGKAAVLRNERERLLAAEAERVSEPPAHARDRHGDEAVRAAMNVALDEDEDESSRPGESVSAPAFSVKGGVSAGAGPDIAPARREAPEAVPRASILPGGSPTTSSPGRERIVVPQQSVAYDLDSRITELELGDDSDASLSVDRLFLDGGTSVAQSPAPAPAAEPASFSMPMQTELSEHPPHGDTAPSQRLPPPVGDSMPDLMRVVTQATASGAKPDIFEIYGKSVREAGIEAAAAHMPVSLPVRPDAVPAVSATSLGAAVELFDHYWRQGFVDDAREILVQTAAIAGSEPWWQARNALVGKSAVAGAARFEKPAPPPPRFVVDDEAVTAARVLAFGKLEAVPRPAPAAASAAPAALRDADWKPLYAELLRIVARHRLPVASPARRDRIFRALSGKPLPEGFLKALAAVTGEQLTESARQLLWNLIGELWSAGPDEACHVLLKTLALHELEARWLGLHLDAMIATGRATQVVGVLLRALRASGRAPLLEWARAGMQRLPRVWEALGVQGFQWSEDDGVAALIAKLEARPRPRLRGLVAGRMPPRQMPRA